MTEWVIMGRVAGLFGLQGWVKLISHTEPRTALLDYRPLYWQTPQGWQPVTLEESRAQGKGIVAKFVGVDDRDAAAGLLGKTLAITREQLPIIADEEIYWADLQGLRVVTLHGQELGTISHLFDTGANDVMVIRGERERLVPFIAEVVDAVDLAAGVVRVDWDPEF